jgi:hypothetical protein
LRTSPRRAAARSATPAVRLRRRRLHRDRKLSPTVAAFWAGSEGCRNVCQQTDAALNFDTVAGMATFQTAPRRCCHPRTGRIPNSWPGRL